MTPSRDQPDRSDRSAGPRTRGRRATSPVEALDLNSAHRITSLRTARSGAFIEVLAERRKLAMLMTRDVADLRLRVGMSLADVSERALLLAAARAAAMALALNIVNQQAITSARMLQRLTRRGHTPGVCKDAIAELTRLGLIDDHQYAQSFVRSVMRTKPAGARLLTARLIQRGVPKDIAAKVVNEALAGVDQRSEAIRLAKARAERMPAKLEPDARRRRLFGLLARRGFSPDVCFAAIAAVLGGRSRQLRESDAYPDT